LRWQVLRAPWDQPRGSERDDLDPTADHAAIFASHGSPLAVGRLHLNSPAEVQVRYMAVAESERGQGLGRQILEYLEAVARRRGASVIVVNAREEVAGFYERLGYQITGAGPTMFGTVAHVRMRKRL
jgi:GNAT superfamily N-acetyltransferase